MYNNHVAKAIASLPFLLIIMVFTSCQDDQPTQPEQRYFYYPKANVYYDAESLEYIYSLDSARTWVKMRTVNGQQPPASLGDQVIIKERSDNIWNENAMHRNMYGGVLYNILTSDTSLLTEKPKQIKKPVDKKGETKSATKKKRNIFQKIFGKKKN